MIGRSMAFLIGLGFLLGASAARAGDEKPAQKKVADIAGVWNSDWGPVTLQTTPRKDGKTLAVRGSYDSNTGASRTGHIKPGTFDPATGILEFALEEPWWDNDTKGTAKLTLAAGGQKFEGPYLKTNKDGGRDEGTVTFTRVHDVAGVWESPWGTITLRTAHASDEKLSVTGSYDSSTGANRTGLITSGTFDPATGILEFALEEPWWDNDTKGTAKLTLAAGGQKFEGPYLKTNKDGGRDEGTVTLTRVHDVAGVWESPWGTITLRTAHASDEKLSVTGSYDSSTGANRTGLITSGTFDPATGILEFALEEPWWDNDTKGTAKLTLAAGGQKFEGPYLKTNKDGGRDEGTVTLTHVSDTEWKADVAGIWESPWGIVTLRTAPAGGQQLSVTGSYNSNTGKNRTGLIESGVYDPATGVLEFALEEPWWGNQTKGSSRLTLDATGNRFKGSYTKTNQGGDKDEGEVSLLRLGGSNFEAALDSIFADAGIKADTPGAAVMVIDHGKVILSKCAGLANVKEKRAITPQTTFELASTSKNFTGAAILRLYEQGKLDLEDDIRKFIPEIPVYDAKNPIRILHVARHTSGLPEVVYAGNVKSKKNRDYLTNEDFADEFARQQDKFPLKYPTAQGYEYSNTGYIVLALIVERVSKQSYSDFMKKEFFEPLGMKTAGVNDRPSYAPSNPALGYHKEKDAFQFIWGPASITHAKNLEVGDGGVFASLDDMARWDAGWRQGKIIKPATQKQALVPSTYGDNLPNVYAFGWGLTVAEGRLQIMEHNGNYAGFLTNIVRDVPEQRTLVVLCNVDSVDVGAIERIFQEMPPKRQQK